MIIYVVGFIVKFLISFSLLLYIFIWLFCLFLIEQVMFFSGVGPIAISAASKVKHVYANNLNPNAIEYLERNIATMKIEI
jgi:tRNA G26 N,N-dimethylase Trm1